MKREVEKKSWRASQLDKKIEWVRSDGRDKGGLGHRLNQKRPHPIGRKEVWGFLQWRSSQSVVNMKKRCTGKGAGESCGPNQKEKVFGLYAQPLIGVSGGIGAPGNRFGKAITVVRVNEKPAWSARRAYWNREGKILHEDHNGKKGDNKKRQYTGVLPKYTHREINHLYCETVARHDQQAASSAPDSPIGAGDHTIGQI